MSKNATSILDDLLETLNDGQEGFRTAAEDVTSESIKSLFGECSLQRVKYIAELQALSKSLGEPNPTDSPSLVSKVHRGWIDLKSVLTSKDEKAILAECERGEDYALKAYRTALEAELPAAVREVVQSQLEGITAAHDKVRAMRDRWASKG